MPRTIRVKRQVLEAQQHLERLRQAMFGLEVLRLYDAELAGPVIDRVLDLLDDAQLRLIGALREARAKRVTSAMGRVIDFSPLDHADRDNGLNEGAPS